VDGGSPSSGLGRIYQEEPDARGPESDATSDSYPGERFNGQLSLVDPFIDDVKRTGRVRLDIQNPELKLKPDMYVDVLLEMNMGKSLVVPVSAIMPTGKHNIAFVDKGEGKLEPRFLELGGKYGNVYAVKSGLKEGERVVASANFLIDAESKIQGALKSW
jgi:Cu(I)/Ag(I) efflux system membrane fusion protein